MKQTVLIDISMHSEKCQRKAMTIAAGFSGVDKMSLKGQDKNQIEVVGDQVNIIELTKLLRKKLGRADLVSVSPVKEEEKKEETVQPSFWSYSSQNPPSQYLEVIHPGYHNEPNCSIM